MADHIVVIVHHNCKRLTEDNGAPYDNVTPTRAVILLYESRKVRQRNLRHHSSECPNPVGLNGYTDLKSKQSI